MTQPVPAFDWIGHHADLSPDAVALVDDGRDLTLTYADLEEQSRRLADWLAGNGVDAGDRVAFLAGNTTDVFEALFACAKLNAILVPLNWRLAIPELDFIIKDCRPQVLIYEDTYAAEAAEQRPTARLTGLQSLVSFHWKAMSSEVLSSVRWSVSVHKARTLREKT